MFKCKISRPKKKAQGNLSSYSGLVYENIHAYEEMKILRASPIKVTAETTSTNEDVEAGQRVSSIIAIFGSFSDYTTIGRIPEPTAGNAVPEESP